MSERMKWLVLSMLVSLSDGSVCRNSGSCSCQWVSNWNWEIRCPSDSNSKFIARFNVHTGNYQVECYNATSWSEFGYRATPPLSRLRSTLTIEQCPLPDESFDNISKIFGLESTSSLTFTSRMNLSSTLTPWHLSMLSALDRLNLSSNGLTELPSDLFRNLSALDVLDLSFNEIAALPHDIFHGLSILRILDLSNNAMKFVDWRLFGDCTKLNQLSMRENFLTSLDHRTFRNVSILNNQLMLNDLGFVIIDQFYESRPLVLDISGNDFFTLPERLFPGIGLREIRLSHNRGNLTSLPTNFLNDLSQLEEVILIRNNLTSLPENIFWHSTSVQNIDLHGNALSTLPENIFRDLRDLISLDLSENGLNYVTEGLFRPLISLQRLNLARNSIASLSANIFRNLTSLLELNLGFNDITNIHETTFRNIPNIQLIRLSHNSVVLAGSQFWHLGNYFNGSTIQTIFLDHNNLTGWFYIENINFEIPASLKLVDLTYNQISYVVVESPLIGSHDVEYDLRHNNLSDVLIDDEISSKVNILVDDNPLDCGCKIYALLKHMHKMREPQSGENVEVMPGNALCSQPYWIEGTPVADLQLETFTCRPDDAHRYVRCAEGCDCWWRPHDRTRIVNCSSRNFGKMPDEIIDFILGDDSQATLVLDKTLDQETRWFHWRDTRVELDLSNNSLMEIPTLSGTGYEHVELLVLSYNNVSRLSFGLLPPRLKVLRVDHNDLRTLNATTVQAVMKSTTLKEVNLEKNPWNCDAETRNRLVSLEEKFGTNVRYSFDIQTCLDSRRAKSSGNTDRLYISYACF